MSVLPMDVLLGFQFGKIILDPFSWPSPTSVTAVSVFIVFTPLLCHSILLTRLSALYPVSGTRLVTLLKLFAFLFCVKCASGSSRALLSRHLSPCMVPRSQTRPPCPYKFDEPLWAKAQYQPISTESFTFPPPISFYSSSST